VVKIEQTRSRPNRQTNLVLIRRYTESRQSPVARPSLPPGSRSFFRVKDRRNGMDNCIDRRDSCVDVDEFLVDTAIRRYRCSEKRNAFASGSSAARVTNAMRRVPNRHFTLELLLRAGQLNARILIGEGLQPLAVFGT